jgi:RHS repeat-associated protein
LWQANAQDPLGHVTQEQFANGHISSLGFDQTNGRLYSVQTGLSGGALIQNLSYHWDALGNLLRRADNAQGIDETFTYDPNYRLSTVTRNGTQTLAMGYNDIGNVTSKSDGAGAYIYTGAQAGCTYYGHSQPHAVRKVGTNVYCYDANGNMVSRSGASVTWSTFNYPTTINQAGGNTSTFYYGAKRNTYRQVSVDAGVTENRVTIGDGAFERLIRGSQTEYRHFVSVNSRVVAIVKRSSQTGNKKFYPHADHLGSVDVTTDETGAVFLRTSFDAWGKRRGGTWTGAPTAPEKTAIGASTHRGYTGHEQLDNLNLVHMKGRVYDPVIARFMSADPIIQSPFRSQSFNRYSYIWNNPLNATDPTGLQRNSGQDCHHTTGSRIRVCENRNADTGDLAGGVNENGQRAGGGSAGAPSTTPTDAKNRSAEILVTGQPPVGDQQQGPPEPGQELEEVDPFQGNGQSYLFLVNGKIVPVEAEMFHLAVDYIRDVIPKQGAMPNSQNVEYFGRIYRKDGTFLDGYHVKNVNNKLCYASSQAVCDANKNKVINGPATNQAASVNPDRLMNVHLHPGPVSSSNTMMFSYDDMTFAKSLQIPVFIGNMSGDLSVFLPSMKMSVNGGAGLPLCTGCAK